MADGDFLHESLSGVTALRNELQRYAAAPQDGPQGLIGRHYTEDAYFDHEKETVLSEGWFCVGRADEIAETGKYITITLLDEPIIVVNTGEGYKALSNVCRHRGMPLVQGTGSAKLFVCPYHAWSYRLNGQLQRAPRMDNKGFDPKTCTLPEFHCIEKFGFLYVSLSEQPSDLDKALAGLTTTLAPYQPEQFRLVHVADEIWHTNWKCLVENFMEGYHLSVVHPQTLHGYTPTELSTKGPNGEGFTSYFANYPEHIPSRGQGAPTLAPENRHKSFLFATYPCQVVSISPSLLVSLNLFPRSAGRVDVRWTMSTYGDELDEATLQERIVLWSYVNREDREKLELMQKALSSRHATGGPLAGEDFEGTVRDFLIWLAKRDQSFG